MITKKHKIATETHRDPQRPTETMEIKSSAVCFVSPSICRMIFGTFAA